MVGLSLSKLTDHRGGGWRRLDVSGLDNCAAIRLKQLRVTFVLVAVVVVVAFVVVVVVVVAVILQLLGGCFFAVVVVVYSRSRSRNSCSSSSSSSNRYSFLLFHGDNRLLFCALCVNNRKNPLD